MGRNKIIIGLLSSPLYTIEDNQIRSINETSALDIVGAELSIDEMMIEVVGNPNDGKLIAPSDYDAVLTSDGYLLALPVGFSQMRELPYGTEIRYYRDGVLRGLYYSKSVERVSSSVYKISAQSVVGLLSNLQHFGNVYTGQTFSDVLDEIINGSIPYSINQDVANTKIYGWLPIGTKRENLHQLLFATGATLEKDENGNAKFVFLDTENVTEIPPNRIFYGGMVDYSTPASGVEITEHSFFHSMVDETVTLFDNTDGSSSFTGSTFVNFRESPLHSLTTTGSLEILESGVNYAVVSGMGTLEGKKYAHTTRTIKLTAQSQSAENLITVNDVTLISVVNSENVAKRLLSYYSSKKTVSTDIVNEEERAGQLVSFSNPYGESEVGYIARMENSVSSILKSACEIITDYAPEWHGNNYSSASVYSGTFGTFEVGENGALCVLIGGGSGGYSGGDGEQGANGTNSSFPSPGGSGGVGGYGGAGGRIFVLKLQEGSYSFSCGAGGTGGTSQNGTEPTAGSDGENTNLYLDGVLLASSGNGMSSPNGYINTISGDVYASSGNIGIAGASGGDRASGTGYGENLELYAGGSPGRDSAAYYGHVGYGGAGGGAAIGSNGSNAEVGTASDNQGHGSSRAGAGGKGADASERIDTPTTFGNGGHGGHGGGGGGAAGTAEGNYSAWVYASGGAGGTGGKGTNGANGCVIVYR